MTTKSHETTICLGLLLAASWPPVSASSAKLAAYRVPFAKNKLLVQRAIKRWGLDVTIDELQEVVLLKMTKGA